MPIAKHLRKFYRGAWATSTRPRILTRAANRCEQCGKPNGVIVQTVSWVNLAHQAMMLWRKPGTNIWHWQNGKCSTVAATDEFFDGPTWRREARLVRCVLTIAHLNHVAGDDRDENLKALCQWCHLHMDKEHHAETRATRKDAARPLLQEESTS